MSVVDALYYRLKMKILNRPPCIKCGEPALTLVCDIWMCGNCYVKLNEKMKKKRQELFLKELQDD